MTTHEQAEQLHARIDQDTGEHSLVLDMVNPGQRDQRRVSLIEASLRERERETWEAAIANLSLIVHLIDSAWWVRERTLEERCRTLEGSIRELNSQWRDALAAKAKEGT